MRNILTIAKKELRSFFDNPASYVVLTVFLLLWEFLFFRSVFLVGETSLRMLYDLFPWLMLILVPALTMGSIAKEKDEGTLELLLTHPLKEVELIIGKFLGITAFITSSLLFALPIAFSLSSFGKFDWGVFLGQFLGSVFFTCALVTLGIFVSSLLYNQIAALLVSAVTGFFFIIVGSDFFAASLPLAIAPLLSRLSISGHLDSIARGVIDLRDLWYFFSFTIIFLSLTYLQLIKRKYGNRKSQYSSFQIGISLFIGIAILLNIIGDRIPGRLDLTQDRIYTLSPLTKKTLSQVKDVITITLYVSAKLPAQHAPIVRETKDILRDFQSAASGNIALLTKDPSTDPQLAQEATSLGVTEVQFNVIGQEEFQLKNGYLGLVVSYGDNHESVPFIKDTSDLEYQLTSFIKKLTVKEKKTVAFLSGHGEKDLYSDYQTLNTELSKQFNVKSVTSESFPTSASDAAVLVIAGPTSKIDDKTREVIKEFPEEKKGVLFLIDNFLVNQQAPTASLNPESFADFVKDYGIEVAKDLVYDLRSNEVVRLGMGPIGYVIPYPFWLRALVADQQSPVVGKLKGIILPWASSLITDKDKASQQGYVINKLFSSSESAGTKTENIFLSPDKASFSKENLKEQLLAVSLSPKDEKENSSLGKIIVLGDSDFLTDEFTSNSSDNVAFGISAISWLGQEESLAGIRVKRSFSGKLLFQNETQMTLVKYGNMGLIILIVVGVGGLRIMRRRNLRLLKYSKNE